MATTSLQVAGNLCLAELFRNEGLVLPDDERHGLVVLIRGRPGTGKTTMAMHILQLLRNTTEGDAPSESPSGVARVYLSVEQSSSSVKAKLASLFVHHQFWQSARASKDGRQIVCTGAHLEKQITQTLGDVPNSKELLAKDIILDVADRNPTSESVLSGRLEAIAKAVAKAPGLREWVKVISSFPGDGERQQRPSFGQMAPLGSDMLDFVIREIEGENKAKEAPPRPERPVVVVDGLSILSRDDQRLLHQELQRLIMSLRERTRMTILAFEPMDSYADLLSHQVDMVIELGEKILSSDAPYLIHEMVITKARYQQAALGRHQYKIRNSGIEVFPSVHFVVHRPNAPQHEGYHSLRPLPERKAPEGDGPKLQKSFSGSVLDMLLGVVHEGDSVALLGERESFKTELTRDFLIRGNWGCPFEPENRAAVEESLLISLLDNADDLEQAPRCILDNRGQCPLYKEQCPVTASETPMIGGGVIERKYQKLHLFLQRPGCITASELIHHIRQRIHGVLEASLSAWPREAKVRRAAFWDLTQIEYRFPLLKDDHMFLPALMDLFAEKKIACVFMGAGNARYSVAASAMANNVVFCWRGARPPEAESSDNVDCCSDGESRGTQANATAGRKETTAGNESREGLFLFVDRRSGNARSNAPAEPLWHFPCDRTGRLEVPATLGDLEKPGAYSIARDVWRKNLRLRRRIERIRQMQGVQ